MAQLLFFGALRDLAGEAERTMILGGEHDIAGLIAAIKAMDKLLGSALEEMPLRFAVNGEIVALTHKVTDMDEVAFLPPVSGGQTG